MRSPKTPHEVRETAVKAGVDDRTVAAYIAGRPMRSTSAARVASALRALGYDDTRSPAPSAPSTASGNDTDPPRSAA